LCHAALIFFTLHALYTISLVAIRSERCDISVLVLDIVVAERRSSAAARPRVQRGACA
jgi:hypothetical protein